MEEVTRHSVIWVMCHCDAAAFLLQVNAKERSARRGLQDGEGLITAKSQVVATVESCRSSCRR
jgi:hypothetical protein